MKEESVGIKIYQAVVIMVVAAAIAVIPSLFVWGFHILTLQDPAVIIGLAACYLFAAAAICFAVRYLHKTLLIHGINDAEGSDALHKNVLNV